MLGLDSQVDIYTEGAASGDYDVLARAGLRCRLVPIRGGQTAQDRAELAAMRKLLWADYALPETAQLREADGTRWNVQAGTLAVERGPGGREAYRRALVVRAA